jgi:nucleotidyltransferase substrate binding protein (TIGR01987 family)
MVEDIRWEQRFSNFTKAFEKLRQAVEYIQEMLAVSAINAETSSSLNLVLGEMIKEGLIQRFEYTHELAWNVMKDYAAYQGNTSIGGSRDATREAFNLQLITDGHVWMDMISSRNKTSHTYNEGTAEEIYDKILRVYYPAFQEFQITMSAKRMQTGAE